MMDSQAPQPTGPQTQRKAREILDGMSRHRIDPTTIKMTDSKPFAKGGQGTIVLGTRILPEEVATLIPEEVLKPFLERQLAIKQFEWNREGPEESAKFFNSFANELGIMASLSHPNVVEFIGFVEDTEKGDAWIVLPWEPNGNVREFLASGEWDTPERLSLIKDVADGVEYLHTRQPPICHGDLKSSNILISSSCHAVITDFGSARAKGNVDPTTEDTGLESPCCETIDIDENVQRLIPPKIKFNRSTLELTLTGPGFSLRWTAPEVLNNGVQDLPSDMWALGWICWEIFTGKIPFEELNAPGPIISTVIKGKLPAIREDADLSHVLRLCGLMMDCWMLNQAERIDASTFRRKVRFMPSSTPSAARYGGAKVRSAALLNQLGMMYMLQSNTAVAESHYQSAIEIATRTKDDKAKANALYNLGDSYRVQWRNPEARKALSEAHEIHSRIGNDFGAANALDSLGKIYRAQSRNQEAEKVFTEAHEIHSRIGQDMGTANALNGLAQTYRAQSRYQESEKALMEVHEIYSRIGEDMGTANALNGLAQTYRAQSRYQESEKAFMEAYKIHSRSGHNLGTANVLVGLGETYRAQSRYQEAEKAFMEAHEISSRMGNDLSIANALTGLGEIYRAQSRNQEAEKAWSEVHEIQSRIGNEKGAARALLGLGTIYRAQLRNSEAENAFKDAQNIYSRIEDTLGTGNAFHNLARLYSTQNRYDVAEASYLQAAASYDLANAGDGRAKTLLALGKDYHTQYRLPDAEEAVSEALAICISTANEEGQADASILLAKIFQLQSRYSEALIQAEATLAQSGPDGIRAASLDQIGHIHVKQSAYGKAEECYRLAQAIYSSLDDIRGEAHELCHLGFLYNCQGRADEAVECFGEARVAYARVGSVEREAGSLDMLVALYTAYGRFGDAREACMEAWEVYARMGRPMNKISVKLWEFLRALQ